MADLGFLPVVRQLLDMTPADGQRLLFSATLDGDVATLVEHYLTDPAVHALATAVASVDTMSHHVYRVPFEAKFDLVASIAAREGRTLCFVRTKHGADRLAKNLAAPASPPSCLHGGRTQAQRTRRSTRSGRLGRRCSSPPTSPRAASTSTTCRSCCTSTRRTTRKDYLHRSGRTARAGGAAPSCC